MGGELLGFLTRRVLMSMVVLFCSTCLIFFLVYLAPGNPAQSLLAGTTATPERVEAVKERYGLDRPLAVQLFSYIKNVATLDFGQSYTTHERVLSAIVTRMGVTGPLIIFAFLLALLGGTIIGTFAAYHWGSTFDRMAVLLSIIGSSAPPFAIALVLLYIFALRLGWFPAVASIGQTSGTSLGGLVLPSVALGLYGMGSVAKFVRVSVFDSLDQEYVLFARARGLATSRVVVRYVLRNAMVGITSVAGIILVAMLVLVPLVEIPFSLNGVGNLLVSSVLAQDVPLIQGIAILTTVAILSINLIVDVLYSILDPRIRAKGAQG